MISSPMDISKNLQKSPISIEKNFNSGLGSAPPKYSFKKGRVVLSSMY